MTPYERKEFNADFIAWLIVVVIFVFILIVYQTTYSYANQSTSNYLPEQVRMLGRCPDCHLVKQPPSECGEFVDTAWLWLECTAMEHRYPNE